MENQDQIFITQSDFNRIYSLIKAIGSGIAEPLAEELDRATVVPDQELPNDVVAMNCRIAFQDLDSKKETHVTLVYPQDAKIDESKISILTPIGSALIGLRVGQTIQWPFPNGKSRKLKVVSVEAVES